MPNEQPAFKRLNFSGFVPGSILQIIVIDAICPYMLYPLLVQRVPTTIALLVVALVPLTHILVSFFRRHDLDVLGIVTRLVIASLLASSYILRDNLLHPALRYALPIGIMGILCLLSFLFAQPLLFFVDRYFSTRDATTQITEYNAYWHDSHEYRRMIKVMNAVWGIGQTGIAILLLALFFVVPYGLHLLLLPFIAILTYIVLTLWTVQYKSMYVQRWTAMSEDVR
jgi:hypothetical protein